MLLALMDCVTVQNATYSLINHSLTVNYDVNLTQECSFYELNEVSAFVFSVIENNSDSKIRQSAQSEKVHKLHAMHNTVAFAITTTGNWPIDVRQGVLIFENGDEIRQVTLPCVSVTLPKRDLIQLDNIRIYFSSMSYRIVVAYTLEYAAFLSGYSLAEIIVLDEFKLSDNYNNMTHEQPAAVQTLGSAQRDIVNMRVQFMDREGRRFEAGEVFARLDAQIFANITFVYVSETNSKPIYIRKQNVYVDQSLSASYQVPTFQLFFNKIGYEIEGSWDDIAIITTYFHIWNVNNANDTFELSQTTHIAARSHNYSIRQIFTGFGSYMMNSSHRSDQMRYETFYRKIAQSSNRSDDYRLDFTLKVTDTEGNVRAKEWPDVEYQTYKYELRDIIISPESLDVLICSHYDYEKREKFQIAIHYALDDDYRTTTTKSDYYYSGVQLVKEISMALGCSMYSFGNDDFVISQDFIAYAADPQYSFSRVMSFLYKQQFTALGENTSELVHYVFRITNGGFVNDVTNYMFNQTYNLPITLAIVLTFFAAQICLVIFWQWLERMRRHHINHHQYIGSTLLGRI